LRRPLVKKVRFGGGTRGRVCLLAVDRVKCRSTTQTDSLSLVTTNPAISCIIYAAKSTEDKRGSIPDQLHECREAIESDPRRHVVAEYEDEAFSAYRRDRGPDLRDAMEHAEELASERGTAELWALHSDRLARGDGRSARHAVEIALWALKRDVKVRTIQDPDTFRDLLYAVVTGQRNHEDSRRKGLAVAAGRRRAVERGDYTGNKPDGYRRGIAFDERGNIKKWLEIDPVRRPLIEKIFAMALRGKGTGEIARAVGDEGWRTKPLSKRQQPKPLTVHSVREVLTNPRYAGLSVYRGVVLAPGNWPAYITERQHHRLRAQLTQRRPGTGPRRREPFLLSRLARCGLCDSPMHCVTGELREDGTFGRRYVCRSHHWHRHAGRCAAPRIDADVLEAMFVSAIRPLLIEGSERPSDSGEPSIAPARNPPDVSVRERLRQAVLAGDDQQTDATLEQLLTRASGEAAMLEQIAASSRAGRQLQVARRFELWMSNEPAGRSEASRARARELNRLLKGCFTAVAVVMDARSVRIVARPRGTSGTSEAGDATEVCFDRREWLRWSPVARRRNQIYAKWEDSEILGALQAWVDAHGRVPRAKDWSHGRGYHPNCGTVVRRFGSWSKALIAAGLQPTMPQTRYRWDDAEIVAALQRWTARHGRPPAYADWTHATCSRPGTSTVANHFGSWRRGLVAAGV
jgi:DNA invertase Pin-like site-specific DNA recombinase